MEAIGAVLDRVWSVVAASWLTIAAIVISGVLPRLRASRITRFLAWRTRTAMIVAALLSLACGVIVFLGSGTPVPRTNDDVAHLLLADTLLHGRLANPPHPFWRALVPVLALDHPTYASLYPPGNGVALAFGSIVFSLPIAGLWLCSAAAAAAMVWAARAFLPRAWSTLAGLILAIHPTLTLWSTVYFGGALPLFGGALLVGAVGRLARRPTSRNAILGVIGLLILANTRPWEGLWLAIAMVPLVWRVVPSIVRVSVPAIALLVLGFAAIGFYNHAVTGNAFLLPHALWDRQYQTGANFIWGAPKSQPTFPNEEARIASHGHTSWHARLRERGVLRASLDKLELMADTVTAPEAWPNSGRVLLWLPVLFLPMLRRQRTLLVALAIFLIAPLTTSWWLSRHYVAPAGALVLILYLAAARRACAAAPRRGGWLLAVAMVVIVAMSADAVIDRAHMVQNDPRAELMRSLHSGRHLILVPASLHFMTWNGADLENAPVLWAREIDAQSDAALLRHYTNREVWRLAARDGRLTLERLR